MSDIERYILRPTEGIHKLEWGIVYLDESNGMFMAYTSFGTYAYRWYSIGTATLKEFLLDLDFDYFMGKTVGRPEIRVFDFHATVAGVREFIRDQRRQGALDKDEARDAWDDIEDIQHDNGVAHSLDLFTDKVYSSRAIYQAYGGDFEDVIRYRPNPQCVGFWKVIWPELLKQITPTASLPELAVTSGQRT